MGGVWHKLNEKAAADRYLSGASAEQIAREYDVSISNVRAKLKRAGVEMRARAGGVEKWLGLIQAGQERAILVFLAKNGPHVAAEINNNAWNFLRDMEGSYLVCRASDYEDPRSFHKWRITGCGMLELASFGRSVAP